MGTGRWQNIRLVLGNGEVADLTDLRLETFPAIENHCSPVAGPQLPMHYDRAAGRLSVNRRNPAFDVLLPKSPIDP